MTRLSELEIRRWLQDVELQKNPQAAALQQSVKTQRRTLFGKDEKWKKKITISLLMERP